MKISKVKITALIALVLIGSIVIAVRYHKPVDIESVCKEASQPLVNNISSSSPIDKTLRSLEVEGYKPLVLESSKQSKGLLREKFELQIFEVKNYELNRYWGRSIPLY